MSGLVGMGVTMPSKPRTLRFHLTSLVFVSVVPLLIFAVIMAALFEKQQRASLERSFRDTARALTVAVDHELTSSISALQALATSEHLDTGDLKLFYREAQRVVATHPGWLTINLTDLSGQQLINVSRPFGARLPSTVNLEDVRHTIDTGQPAISNLFVGLVLNVPTVGVTVPVTRGGMLKYALGARLDVGGLSRLLSEGKLPPNWVATIIDRNGIIIARTRGIETFLGKPATPEFVARSRQSDEGSFRDVTRDGTAVYGAYSRSRPSGWTVGLGVPGAVVEAPGRTSRWAIIGGGCVFLLLAAVLAAVFGRRIAGGIGSLSTSARALGQGEVPSLTERSKISEFADVEREMVEAARQRADAVAARLKTEEALRESEERTRLIVSHALDAVITADAQGRITTWNPQAETLFGWSPDEVLGRLLSETIIPPAYREAHERGMAHFRATGEGPVFGRRIELTALHRNGREFPIELAITPMREVNGATTFSAFLRDITERRSAEAALRESEERFRAVFESTTDCVVVWDGEYKYLYANEAAIKHVGTTRDQVIGKNIRDALGHIPDFMHVWMRRIDEAMTTSHVCHVEDASMVGPLQVWSESVISPLRNAMGQVYAVAVVYRDITERRRSEQALRDSEANFRLLFADNPLPMWLYDHETLAFLEVNEAAVVGYGYSREEFLRMRITDIRPPDDVSRLRKFLESGLPSGQRRSGEWRHQLKDGRIIEVLITSHSMEFAGRRAALVVATDVTELKQTQASLATSTERLTILHEIDRALIAAEPPVAMAETVLPRLRDLLGVPRAIVNLFDLAAGEAEWLAAAGRRRVRLGPGVRFPLALMGDVEALRRGELQVIDVASLPPSPHAEALLASGVHTYMVVPMIAGGELIGGLSFGGAANEFPPEQVSIAREAATQLAIALEQARLRERVKRHTEELEQRVHERTLELSAVNEQLEQQIGERRRAETEADRANRTKSDFLANMSHELRTPLNAIIGFAELMHDGKVGPVAPDHKEYLGDILTSSRHLLQLINDVLDLSKIEAGKMEFHPEPVDLPRLVTEVRDILRTLAAQKRIEVRVEVDQRVGTAVLDPAKLKQVLYNYLSNALKFTPEQGRVTIRVREESEKEFLLEVEDTGAGIRPDDIGKLFVEFQQLEASIFKAHAGTGLGLALTKRIVEAQGGRVGVRSTPGHGSVFFAVLPRTARPAGGQPGVAAPTP